MIVIKSTITKYYTMYYSVFKRIKPYAAGANLANTKSCKKNFKTD